MSFFLSLLVYFMMAAILVLGIVMAVKGTFWILIAGFVLFILAVGRICAAAH